MANTEITEPIILDSTGKELVAATWAVASILSGGRQLTMREIKEIVKSGGGKKVFPVGTELIVQKENGTAYPFVFVHHGEHVNGTPYAHLRLMKALHLLQYDAAQAFYYAENGLAAGTYNFSMPAAYGATPAGNYQFTLASDVPAGGQLMIPNAYSETLIGKNIAVYNTQIDTASAQTAVVSGGTDGASLGSLQIAGDPDATNMNSIQRTIYGSNNYAQSALREWMNSDAQAGSVWTPTNKFQRPPSWKTTIDGFLSLLPQDFVDIVDEINVATDTNNVFETGYSTNDSYITKDKFWLPSRYQIFGSVENHNFNEIQWEYYKGASNEDRIMYDASGTARSQWLRSPYVSGASHVRFCTYAGVLSYYGATNTYVAAPACEI